MFEGEKIMLEVSREIKKITCQKTKANIKKKGNVISTCVQIGMPLRHAGS